MTMNNPNPLNPCFKRRLVSLIDSESSHRKGLDDTKQMIDNRIIAKKIWEVNPEASISFRRNGRSDDSVDSKKEIMKMKLSNMEKVVKQMEIGIKYSRWKEKFFRYCYNNNLEKALEYNEKLQNWWHEENEDLREGVMDDNQRRVVSMSYGKEKGTKVYKGEEAYKEHSDEMFRFYKIRIHALNNLRYARDMMPLEVPE